MADDIRYGSDHTGLVWGYAFAAGVALPVNTQNLASLLAATRSSPDQFLWLHFSLANSATVPWLKHQFDLPGSFFEELFGDAGSSRLEQEAESLVVFLNDVIFDLHNDAVAISSGRLYIDRRLVISVRLRPLRSLEKLRNDVRVGVAFSSSVMLLAHLLQDQVGVLVTILRRNSARIDQIEDQLLAARVAITRSKLGAIRRVLVRLMRLLAPEPAAFFRLVNKPPVWIAEAELAELRQSAEEFSVAVGDTTNLIERVKLLQEELVALVNEQSNRTLSILTLVTVLALPINLSAGLFGMNVGGVPWANAPHGFLLVGGSICFSTLLLALLVLKRQRE